MMLTLSTCSPSNTKITTSALAARLLETTAAFFELNNITEESQKQSLAWNAFEEFWKTNHAVQEVESAVDDSNEAILARPDSVEEVSQGGEQEQSADGAIRVSEAEAPQDIIKIAAYYKAAKAVTGDSAVVAVTTSDTGRGVHTRWSYPEGGPLPAPIQSKSSDGGSGPAHVQSVQAGTVTTRATSPPSTPRKNDNNLAIVTPRSQKRTREGDSSVEHPDSPPTTRQRVSESDSQIHPAPAPESPESPSNNDMTPLGTPLRREYAFYKPPSQSGSLRKRGPLLCFRCAPSTPPSPIRQTRDKTRGNEEHKRRSSLASEHSAAPSAGSSFPLPKSDTS